MFRLDFETIKTIHIINRLNVCLQDKKRIARKKAEVKQAELLAAGIDVRDQTNILDEEDNDLLF